MKNTCVRSDKFYVTRTAQRSRSCRAACSQRCRSKRSSSSKFSFLRVLAMAWEGDAQDIDLWAAVRTIMAADAEELGLMFDRLPLRDLVRHQVAMALAVERSLHSEDPPIPHCTAAAAVFAQTERASSSTGSGPFFATQPTLSAAAQQLQAKGPPALYADKDQFVQPKTQDTLEVKSVPAKPGGMAPLSGLVAKSAPVKATPAQVASILRSVWSWQRCPSPHRQQTLCRACSRVGGSS